MSSLKNNLKEILGNTTMLRVTSKQEKQKYFALREEVFCNQKGWESLENNVTEHDSYSCHVHLIYSTPFKVTPAKSPLYMAIVEKNAEGYLRVGPRKTVIKDGEACFRMIPASNPLNMPITQETGIQLFNDPIAKKYISELSRLAVNPNQEELYWGTILSIAIESGNNEIPFQVALMTKPFIRKINMSLRRLLKTGIKPLQIIGGPVQLNGDRYPVVFNISEILMLIKILDKEIYNQYFSKSHNKLKEFIHKNKDDILYTKNHFNVLEDIAINGELSIAS